MLTEVPDSDKRLARARGRSPNCDSDRFCPGCWPGDDEALPCWPCRRDRQPVLERAPA